MIEERELANSGSIGDRECTTTNIDLAYSNSISIRSASRNDLYFHSGSIVEELANRRECPRSAGQGNLNAWTKHYAIARSRVPSESALPRFPARPRLSARERNVSGKKGSATAAECDIPLSFSPFLFPFSFLAPRSRLLGDPLAAALAESRIFAHLTRARLFIRCDAISFASDLNESVFRCLDGIP